MEENQLIKLNFLIQQKRIHPAEQIIFDSFKHFEESVPQNLEEKAITDIEKHLLQILRLNEGNLSLQIGNRLGECFIYLYTLPYAPKIFNLVAELENYPSAASYYTTARVLNEIGSKNQSSVSRIVDQILKKPIKSIHATLYLLCYCYKTKTQDLKQYVKRIIDITLVNVSKPQNEIVILCIKLLKMMIYTNEVTFDIIKNHQRNINYDTAGDYVRSKTYDLVATFLASAASNGSNIQDDCNKIAVNYNAKTEIFTRYLTMLDPALVNGNAHNFSHFIRRNLDEAAYRSFSNLLNAEIRHQLFDNINKESPPGKKQLSSLIALADSEEEIKQVASLCVDTALNEIHDEREIAVSFFKLVSKRFPDIARDHLLSAATFLSRPPDDHQQLSRQLVGYALIIAQISLTSPSLLSDQVIKSLGRFLKWSLNVTPITRGGFVASFVVLDAIPESIAETIVEKSAVDAALLRVPKFYFEEFDPILGDPVKMRYAHAAVLKYLYHHPNYEVLKEVARPLFDTTMQSVPGMTYGFCALNKSFNKIPQELASSFVQFVEKMPQRYGASFARMAAPYRERIDTSYSRPERRASFNLTDEEAADLCIEAYGRFAVNVGDQGLVNRLALIPVRPDHMLSVAMEPRGMQYVPKSILDDFRLMISHNGTNEKSQAAIEAVARFICASKERVDNIGSYVERLPEELGCLLWGCVLANLKEASDSLLLSAFTYLSQKHTKTAAFALRVLLEFYPAQAGELSLGLGRLNAVLLELGTESACDPARLRFLCDTLGAAIQAGCAEEEGAVLATELLRCTRAPGTRMIINSAFKKLCGSIGGSRLDSRFQPVSSGLIQANAAADAESEAIMNGIKANETEHVAEMILTLQLGGKAAAGAILEAAKRCGGEASIWWWTSTLSEVLLKERLPNADVAPESRVRTICLRSLCPVVRRLSEMKEDSALNDCVKCAIKGSSEIDMKPKVAGYELLILLMDLFDTKPFANDLSNLLKNSAIKCINVSYPFVTRYVAKVIQTSEEADSFASALQSAVEDYFQDPTSKGFVAVAAAAVAKFDRLEFDKAAGTVSKLAFGPLCETLLQAMKLWKSSNSDMWRELSAFRVANAPTFADVAPAAIVAQSYASEKRLDEIEVADFAEAELSKESPEQWRVDAAVGCAIALARHGLLPECSRSGLLANIPAGHPRRAEFLKCLGRTLERGDIMAAQIFDGVEKSGRYDKATLTMVVRNAPESALEEIAPKLFKQIVENELDEKAETLAGALFERMKDTDETAEMVAKGNNMKLVELYGKVHEPREAIVAFVVDRFAEGGMETATVLLESKPTETVSKLLSAASQKITEISASAESTKFLLTAARAIEGENADIAKWIADIGSKVLLGSDGDVRNAAADSLKEVVSKVPSALDGVEDAEAVKEALN